MNIRDRPRRPPIDTDAVSYGVEPPAARSRQLLSTVTGKQPRRGIQATKDTIIPGYVKPGGDNVICTVFPEDRSRQGGSIDGRQVTRRRLFYDARFRARPAGLSSDRAWRRHLHRSSP